MCGSRRWHVAGRSTGAAFASPWPSPGRLDSQIAPVTTSSPIRKGAARVDNAGWRQYQYDETNQTQLFVGTESA